MLQQKDNPFFGHTLYLYFGHDQKSYSIQKSITEKPQYLNLDVK